MKLFNIIVFSVLVLGMGTLGAQSQFEIFKNQDYSAIEAMLSKDVSVKINSGSKIIGFKKGIAAIRRELSDFAPIRMESKHEGSSEANDDNYLIAKFFNAEGERMRIFIHLENSGNSKRICDVKIRRRK